MDCGGGCGQDLRSVGPVCVEEYMAVYGSGFKGQISIRETYQVLTLLDFTQREAVENPCGLDISFPDVDTGLILCVQQNIPTVVDLFPFFCTDFVEDLPAPLPLFLHLLCFVKAHRAL